MGDPSDHDALVPACDLTPALRPTPLALRIVIAVLLLWSLGALLEVLLRWRASGLVLSPGLAAPFAAWGLWRRRRAWWLVTVGLVWATWIAMVAVVVFGALGPGSHATLGGMHLPGGQATVLAVVALGTCLTIALHAMLMRPEVRTLFPPRGPVAWRPALSLTVAGLILAITQVGAGFTAALLLDLPPADLQRPAALLGNGRLLALMTCVSAPLGVALIVMCVLLRGHATLRDAVALQPIGLRDLLTWLGATSLFLLTAIALGEALDHPQSEFVLGAYRTAYPLWLFWLAILLLAPTFEELLFRGFLFTDLVAAGLRPAPVVALTTALFASLHLGQYGPLDFALVAALGLLLGAARARTGSVYPPLAMHVLMNGWAMLGAAMTVTD